MILSPTEVPSPSQCYLPQALPSKPAGISLFGIRVSPFPKLISLSFLKPPGIPKLELATLGEDEELQFLVVILKVP